MIEAVKHETLPWFAVQWHPERTSEGLGRALPRVARRTSKIQTNIDDAQDAGRLEIDKQKCVLDARLT